MSPINPSRGDMYPDVDGTINFIRGKCEADCLYCFMKYGFRAKLKAYQKPYHLVEKEFETFDAEPGSNGESGTKNRALFTQKEPSPLPITASLN